MKRILLVEGALFATLLLVGVTSRVWLQHLPNFAPVSAIALFAGFYFRSWLIAASLPIVIMGVSDHFIGGYDGRMMALVHGTLALPVLYRGFLRRRCPTARREGTPSARQQNLTFAATVFGTTLVASSVFFLVTNFGSWLWFDMYDHNLAGLVTCYLQALPFFRATLAGDLFFATVLFGGYALAVARGLAPSRTDTLPAASL